MIKKLFSKLTKSEDKTPAIPDLFFKDNASAFEYACKYCVTNIVAKQGLIAIVETEPATDERGDSYCAVNVSSDDGGFTVPSMIATKVVQVSPREARLYGFHTNMTEIGKMLGDDRKGWVGYVVAVANPILKNDSGWSIAKRLI